MTEKAADYIVGRLCRAGRIQERDKGIYKVGFNIVLGTLVNGFVILGTGALLKDAAGALLFLVVFGSVRNRCGGYHARTRLKCLLAMLAAFGCVSVLSRLVLIGSDTWKWGYGAVSVVLGALMSVFVPVADITKRYRLDDVMKNRKKAVRILAIWYAAIGVSIWWSCIAAVKISMTMNVVAVMVLVTKPWKRAVVGNHVARDKAW